MREFPALDGARLHLFGIAGRGMAPLAIVAQHLGATVDGCDRAGIAYARASLERAGIPVLATHDPDHLKDDPELVATSIAPESNDEIRVAIDRGILWHRTDLLAATLRDRPGAGVTGSHGKGTVVALTAVALAHAGLDPVALVGANVPQFGGTARLGSGPLVAEVDDSDLTLSRVSSRVAVVTNLDYDHPHLDTSLEQVVGGVGAFVSNASERVILGPSPRAGRLEEFARAEVWRYGRDYSGRVTSIRDGITRVEVSARGAGAHSATLRLIGPQPAHNAALAFASAVSLGADPAAAAAGLEDLSTITRRLELVGSANGVRVFDDFGGKHPINIRRGLAVLRRHYPDARITALFEPYGPYLARWGNRYARALSDADNVVFLPARYLADYAAEGTDSGQWRAVCRAPNSVAADHDSGVATAMSDSRPGDVVVIFTQINLSRSMALAAVGVSE
jgi:UDP-N-acetylmuramate--alanine ligase